MKVLVTGGAGFIGTSVVRHLLRGGHAVVNLDKLTYAGSNPPLGALAEGDRYALEVADVADRAAVERVFRMHRPDAVMHLAAETHVDRSIQEAQGQRGAAHRQHHRMSRVRDRDPVTDRRGPGRLAGQEELAEDRSVEALGQSHPPDDRLEDLPLIRAVEAREDPADPQGLHQPLARRGTA